MRHDPLLASNELGLISSSGPSVGKTSSIDLDLTSRSKIVIRPRCKEYVLKQRAVRQTLACFTSVNSNADPTKKDSQNTITRIRSEERASSAKKIKVLEGRIEKPAKPIPKLTPVTNLPPTIPTATDSMYADEIAKCGCTTSGGDECRRCRVLRLADRFCSIVTAQCDKWSMESAQSGS